MKKIILFSFFIVSLISCSQNSPLVLQETIIGSWKDLGIYKNYSQNGTIIDTFYTKEIIYSFFQNGRYEIQDGFWFPWLKKGSYYLDPISNIIELKEDKIEDTLHLHGPKQTYTWEVLNFTELKLNVNFNFKQEAIDSFPSIDVTIPRNFIKL